MPTDPIVRPADTAPSYRELREQFREENRQRIHALIQRTFRVIATSPGLEFLVRMRLHLTDKDAQGLVEWRIGQFRQEGHSYKIVSSGEIKGRYQPGDDLDRALALVPKRLQTDFGKQGADSALFTSAEFPGGVDHDGPPIDDLSDEQQIFDAIDKLKEQNG